MTAQKITIHGFLHEFKRRHEQMPEHPFCWVLGSGASVQSGIPTGGTLVKQWLEELHDLEDFGKRPIKEWATAKNLDIPNFEYSRAAEFYPWVYQRRFRDYKEQGYAFLEKIMDHAEPSFGYSVLAQIMANTPHKAAVTTNFDNLIADALSTYTRTFPLVCGHESLTGYIRPTLRRPLVAKIHRDLLLQPLNDPKEIEKLPTEWTEALKRIFGHFTPIVIGYGGNDGSLMGFLKTLTPIEGGVFWCYREGDAVDPKVHEVVKRHRGKLVPIAGFDEVMLQFQETLQLPFLLPQLQAIHDKRVTDYRKQFEDLTAKLRKPAETPATEKARKPVRKAAEEAVERLTKEENWWAWELKAQAEPDPAKREAIYRAGLEDFPESADLTGILAVFMAEVRRNYDEAEQLFRKAQELDPSNAINAGNFALFMEKERKNYDEAGGLYRKTLELDPHHGYHTGNFAGFMWKVRANYDEAERLYQKALEFDPNSADHIGNLASFMWKVRADYDEAGLLYRKALKLDPNHALNTGNLAWFTEEVYKDYDEAERLYRKALELDPNYAHNVGNFARFMHEVRKNYDEAERLYRKGLKLDPANATNTGNFAVFMETVRKNYKESEHLFRKALRLDSNNAINIVNFAGFMYEVRKNYDEAERLYRKASELDPDHAGFLGNFANFMFRVRKDYDEAERLFRKALELDPNYAIHTCNFAAFMEKGRKNYDEAEQLYLRAQELAPDNTWISSRYAEFRRKHRSKKQP
jgi:tetratricopeptide (TPR) repeat protein